MSKLSDFVNQSDMDNDNVLLPLIHSCDGYVASLIMTQNKLKTQLCPVFHKNYLYFFYAKPSYPPAEKIKYNTANSAFSPVCFIINSKKLHL